MTYDDYTHPQRRNIFLGLLIAQMVICLSGTILSTSITPILEEIGGFELFSWMFTAYLLTQTMMIPLAGKFSDIYGRRLIFITGLAIFIVGTVLCGLVNSATTLIVFRAFQGIGAGLMIPVINATVADVFPPSERGKIQGILGSMFSIGMAIGPMLGGVLNDYLGWRSVFFFCVPLLIISMVLCFRTMPSVKREGKPIIDVPGMFLISLLLLLILLIMSFCGASIEWVSVDALILVTASIITAVAFVIVEKRSPNPVMDLRMFRNKLITWACIGLFLSTLCIMGASAYIARFLQGVMLYDATTAGMYMLPFVVGMIITSIFSGLLLNRTGYKLWLIIGPICTSVGLVLMSTITVDTDLVLMSIYMFIMGFGGGCLASILMVAVQNNADPKNMGMAMSGMNIFRSMGTTVATAFIGLIINMVMGSGMGSILPPDIYGHYPSDSGILDHLGDIELLPYVTDIQGLYGDGITTSFLVCGVLVLVLMVLIFYVKGGKHDDS